MVFCSKCGKQLNEDDLYCSECGMPVSMCNNHRKAVYEGEIHKCPNCGEAVNSFVANCPTCGHEFRGANSSTSVREFAARIDEIEMSRPAKSFSFKKVFEDQNEISETDRRKIALIRSFVIPNTKEDLFEFLVLASSNINMQRYNGFDTIPNSDQAVSDAWEAKFEQAYEKAKLCFGNTPEFQNIQAIYEKKHSQIADIKKKSKFSVIGVVLSIVLSAFIIFGFAFSIAFCSNSNDAKRISKENERLDAIVEEIYDAIAAENFVLARVKASELVFSGSSTEEGQQAAEKWEQTRNELIAIINAASNETEINVSDTEAPQNTVEVPTITAPDHSDIPKNPTETVPPLIYENAIYQDITIENFIISIPDYWEEEGSKEDYLQYYAEKGDSVAMLSISFPLETDDNYDVSFDGLYADNENMITAIESFFAKCVVFDHEVFETDFAVKGILYRFTFKQRINLFKTVDGSGYCFCFPSENDRRWFFIYYTESSNVTGREYKEDYMKLISSIREKP